MKKCKIVVAYIIISSSFYVSSFADNVENVIKLQKSSPNGEIVVCCQNDSTINLIGENWSIPPKPKENCLTLASLQFSKSEQI